MCLFVSHWIMTMHRKGGDGNLIKEKTKQKKNVQRNDQFSTFNSSFWMACFNQLHNN